MEGLPVIIFGLQGILELFSIYVFRSKVVRTLASGILLMMLTFSHAGLLIENFSVALATVAFVGIFRAINLLRFGYGRTEKDYLRISAFRSSWRLLVLQGLTYLIASLAVSNEGFLLVLIILLAAFSAIIFLQTARRMAKLDLPSIDRPQATRSLPVVSVAIPARNETEDLSACIKSILESDYPKLEILVYDDCSQDKTPDVIKAFAHKGVRFISGSEPSSQWLAKNSAYNALAQEALGNYILFCGVDLRFEPTAISSMVAIMQKRKLEMLNVLPRRDKGMRYALFYQSARYLWELALPRQVLHRPPALSSCWIAKKTLLTKSGFTAVARSAMPERYFAWKADKQNAYSFMSARNLPLVYSHKTIDEQRLTALRLRYPQLRKRPENVALYTLVASTVVVLPAVILVLTISGHVGLEFFGLAAASILLLNMTNALITSVVSRPHALVSALIFPFVAIVDFWTLFNSMIQYEFGTIEWKGRNVCLPIMHVVPELPKLK